MGEAYIFLNKRCMEMSEWWFNAVLATVQVSQTVSLATYTVTSLTGLEGFFPFKKYKKSIFKI